MFGARAWRVVQGLSGSSQDRNPTSSSQASTANLSESERRARWKIVTLKLLWVLRNYLMKSCTQAALGRDAYQRIFHRIKNKSESSKGTVNRVINGEIVGKMLPAGTNKNQDDSTPADMCLHEAKFMRPRGNRTTNWWTCLNCHSRWERRKREETPVTGTPTDHEMLTFGKHAGKTFLETATAHPDYCQWIIQTADNPYIPYKSVQDPSPQLQRFAQYLGARGT